MIFFILLIPCVATHMQGKGALVLTDKTKAMGISIIMNLYKRVTAGITAQNFMNPLPLLHTLLRPLSIINKIMQQLPPQII